jgi:hypothetical protein
MQRVQHALTAAVENTRLEQHCASEPPTAQARLHSLSSANASRWLTVLPTCKQHQLNDETFRDAAAHRLGRHAERVKGTVQKCICDCDVQADHRHFHTCKMMKAAGCITKHNLVAQALRCSIKELGASVIYEPLKNKFVSPPNGTKNREVDEQKNDEKSEEKEEEDHLLQSQQRGDLLVVSEKGTHFVDVAIVQSDADTYVSLPQHAKQHIAVERMEKMKINKHSDICRKKKWKMVPFIMDSYGYMNDRSTALLRNLSKLSSTPLQWMTATLNRLQVALQKGNSVVVDKALRQCIIHAHKRDRPDVGLPAPSAKRRRTVSPLSYDAEDMEQYDE